MEIKQFQEKLNNFIELMGFEDFSVNRDADSGRFSIFINDNVISEKNIAKFVSDFDYLAKLIAQKQNAGMVFIDINNYRRKREDLILELAKAMARKAIVEKKEMPLPAMNAYERRLVHTELTKHPDIKTESIGEGRERYIIIKPI